MREQKYLRQVHWIWISLMREKGLAAAEIAEAREWDAGQCGTSILKESPSIIRTTWSVFRWRSPVVLFASI